MKSARPPPVSEFTPASYFLFSFYMYHMLVPSCLPLEDTLHELINIPLWLRSATVAGSATHTETATVWGPPYLVHPRQNRMIQHS